MTALLGRVIRTARSDEKSAVLDVILSANPTLEHRIERFRASGVDWHDATPVVAPNEIRY